jgi:predicted nucleic acid-binding protein
LKLDGIVDGSSIFIDSSILIYYFTGVSPQCRSLLARCESGAVRGLASVIVLSETAHRLMMVEAVEAGLVRPGNVATKIREKPALIRRLTRYRERVGKVPLMGIEIVPFDMRLFAAALEIQAQHGLMVNDSIVVATASAANADGIASSDRDFAGLDIPLYSPSDLR